MPIQPIRVITDPHGPIGYAPGESGPPAPIYALYSSEKTYAASISPLGARMNAFNAHRLQPTFSLDLGMVFSARDLPIDNAANINFLFSFGPGLEFFYRPNQAVRLEYLYRHMSNAGTGDLNPGVDQGVFRLTLTHRRR